MIMVQSTCISSAFDSIAHAMFPHRSAEKDVNQFFKHTQLILLKLCERKRLQFYVNDFLSRQQPIKIPHSIPLFKHKGGLIKSCVYLLLRLFFEIISLDFPRIFAHLESFPSPAA